MRMTKTEILNYVGDEFVDNIASSLFMFDDGQSFEVETSVVELEDVEEGQPTALVRGEIRSLDGGLMYAGGMEWVISE